MKTITATEASRRFSQLLDRVKHDHESFAIVRRGEAIAELTAVSSATKTMTLEKLLGTVCPLTSGDRSFADDLEAIQEVQPQPAGGGWHT